MNMDRRRISHLAAVSLTLVATGCTSWFQEERSLPFFYLPSAHLYQTTNPGSNPTIAGVQQSLLQGKADEAIERLTQQLDAATDDELKAELYLLRGVCHYENDETNKAIEDYSESIRHNPADWRPYFHRWQAYLKVGDEKNAQADRDMGRKLNPELFEQDYSPSGGMF